MSRNGDWTFLFDKSKLFILGVYFPTHTENKTFHSLFGLGNGNKYFVHTFREETIKRFVLVVEPIRGRGGV